MHTSRLIASAHPCLSLARSSLARRGLPVSTGWDQNHCQHLQQQEQSCLACPLPTSSRHPGSVAPYSQPLNTLHHLPPSCPSLPLQLTTARWETQACWVHSKKPPSCIAALPSTSCTGLRVLAPGKTSGEPDGFPGLSTHPQP